MTTKRLVIVLTILVLCATDVPAQQPPFSGNTGLLVFGYRAGGADFLGLISLPAMAVPQSVVLPAAGGLFPPLPATAFGLASAFTGAIANQATVGLQAPSAPTILAVNSPQGLILMVSTVDTAGNVLLEWLDLRPGFLPPNLFVTTTATLASGGLAAAGGYRLLDDRQGSVFVEYIDAAGNVAVDRFTYQAGGAAVPFAQVSTFTSSGTAENPWTTDMRIDPTTGNLLLSTGSPFGLPPTMSQVESVNPATMTVVATVTMPMGHNIAANLAVGVVGDTIQDIIALTNRIPFTNGGGTFVAFDGLGMLPPLVPAGGFGASPCAPAGVPAAMYSPTYGLNDPLVTVTGPASSVVTFGVDDVSGFATCSAAAQISHNGPGGPGHTLTVCPVTAPLPGGGAQALNLFGDPEAIQTPGAIGDPVAMMAGGTSSDFLVVVGAGINNQELASPLNGCNSISVAAACGFVDVATIDRPYALPGGRDVMMTSVAVSAAPPCFDLFSTTGIAVTGTVTTTLGAGVGASSLPNATVGIGAPLPAALQGFITADVIGAGEPLVIPPASLSLLPLFGGPAAIPVGVPLRTPLGPGAANPGPRWPVANIRGSIIDVAYPAPGITGLGSTLAIHFALATAPGFVALPAGTDLFLTELISF